MPMSDGQVSGAEKDRRSAVIEHLAQAFVAAAFRELTSQRVIPTSEFHPWVRAGRDYYGPTLMELPEFKACESLLGELYPARFSKPLERRHAEFSNTYLLQLVEACVRRCADVDNYDADNECVSDSIRELIEVLESSGHSLVVVRAVSHLQTSDGQPLTIDGVEIVPERSRQDFDFLLDQCRRRVPGSGGSFNRERPVVFAHPHAVVSTVERVGAASDYVGAITWGSRRLDRFMLMVRLLTGTTARSHFEVQGPTTLVGPVSPHLRRYAHQECAPFVRRTAVLNASLEKPIQTLGSTIDSLQVKRQNMATASFDVAIQRFTNSYESDGLATVVDLATALEAIFIDEPDGTSEVTGRLRNRAAALLATATDSAANVFEDISSFYSLRSSLVHGGNLTESKLRKQILGISTVTEKDHFGIAAAEAVDRMRDLVRRAILARVCLASGDQPIWPFNPAKGVEVAFADDTLRTELRSAGRGRMGDIGAGWAADHLEAPGQTLREDYGQQAGE